MKLILVIIFSAAFAFAASASDEEAWAYVPAARDSRSLWGIRLPVPPTERVVTVIGADRLAGVLESLPRRTFAIEIGDSQDERGDEPLSNESTVSPVPAEACWPDVHGRIAAAPINQSGTPAIPGVRNPWEIRKHARTAEREIVFECGGLVIGGEGGAVAILNGHIVKRGDLVGEFNVVRVFASGLLLGVNGSCFVIPMGRPITVAISGG